MPSKRNPSQSSIGNTSIGGHNEIPQDVSGVNSQLEELDAVISRSVNPGMREIYAGRKAVLLAQREKLSRR